MIRTLPLVMLVALLGMGGCKTDDKMTGGGKDMSMAGDGGKTTCETTKCENPDSQCCNGEPCVDIKNNPLNCGACGKLCRTREVCSNSLCACRSGGHDDICPMDATCCADGCHKLMTETTNCGGCGIACKSGEMCLDGQCKCGPAGLTCKSGQICCGSGCSDLQNDPNNCGMCGHACNPGDKCTNGICPGECAACAAMETCCPPAGADMGTTGPGMCINTKTDKFNCGMCGNVCPKVLGVPLPCFNGVCGHIGSDGGTADM